MTIKEGIDKMEEYFRPKSDAAWRLVGNPYRKRKVEEDYDSFDEEVGSLENGSSLDDESNLGSP